jgi:hypothetical protein
MGAVLVSRSRGALRLPSDGFCTQVRMAISRLGWWKPKARLTRTIEGVEVVDFGKLET